VDDRERFLALHHLRLWDGLITNVLSGTSEFRRVLHEFGAHLSVFVECLCVTASAGCGRGYWSGLK
jgi:hypothetical protein